jgi:hypothetical protein
VAVEKELLLGLFGLKQQFFLNGHTTKPPAEGERTTGCTSSSDLLMMGL